MNNEDLPMPQAGLALLIAASFDGNADVDWSAEDGWEIKCRKGLWGVTVNDPKIALAEAHRYYVQYHADGEYDDD